MESNKNAPNSKDLVDAFLSSVAETNTFHTILLKFSQMKNFQHTFRT
jgi:hypothetical protein